MLITPIRAGIPHHICLVIPIGNSEDGLRRSGRGCTRVKLVEGIAMTRGSLSKVSSNEGCARANALNIVPSNIEIGHCTRSSELYGCNVVRLCSLFLCA
nr:hypothetical protein Itr_chr03CG25090 [Ipomoea trifida]